MKIDKRQGIWLVFAILFILFFLNFASAQTCYCNSCADCNANLSNPACTEVKLITDIINVSGNCINNPSGFNNKIFDCQGHIIDGYDTDYGIYLHSKQNNTIKNCIITDFVVGIYFDYSSNNNTLTNNNVSSNDVGIYLYSSSNNTITNNTAISNSHGIYLYSSSNNTLINNIASLNINYGIYLGSSSNNTLTNNTVRSNSYGILLHSSSNNNTLTNNTVRSNSYGIYLYLSLNSTLTNNTISSNYRGIHLDSSSNNIIVNNIVSSNTDYGILLIYSSNNNIYNNLFNNTKNFYFGGTIYANNWNTTKTEGTNIVGGPYIGGNFWAKPDGTGFSENCTDADEDGICDNAYNLTTDNVDYLPLTYVHYICIISFLNIKPTNNSLFDLPQINFYCEIYNSGSQSKNCAFNIVMLEVNNSANENVINYSENFSYTFNYNFSHKETFNYSDTYYFSCIVKNKINQTFTSEPYKIRIFINYEKLFNIKMIYAIILFVILSIAFIFFYLSMHYKEQTPIATGFLFLGFIFLIADLIGGIIMLKEVGALTETLSGFLSIVTYAVGIIFVLLFMIVLIFGIVRAIKLTKKKKIRDWGLLLEDEE
ncbi:MAG: NosD domain-containing protein [Candidatus Aenigmatarchaeota archaeon]